MVTINSDSVVLFLDFDGVLHPRGGAMAGERFSKKAMLEGLLREPALLHIVIVISSTWREAYSLKSLISIFPEDIHPRIIGESGHSFPTKGVSIDMQQPKATKGVSIDMHSTRVRSSTQHQQHQGQVQQHQGQV